MKRPAAVRAFALVAGCLALAPAARAADHLITFEEAGLSAMSNSPGAPVPAASQLHDQFLASDGVRFDSGGGFVAVVDHGCCTASVPNIIGGTSAGGALIYTAPITISFFDPADTSQPGVTGFVRIRGDFIPLPGTATMQAFGAAGQILGSVTANDSASGVDLALNMSGIHAVVISETSGTIGFDNLEFDTVVAAVPEPASLALMAAGLALLGAAGARRRPGAALR